MQSVFIICYVHLDLPFSFVWYSPYALNTVPLDIISVCQRRIISAQRSGACSFWRRRCVLVDRWRGVWFAILQLRTPSQSSQKITLVLKTTVNVVKGKVH